MLHAKLMTGTHLLVSLPLAEERVYEALVLVDGVAEVLPGCYATAKDALDAALAASLWVEAYRKPWARMQAESLGLVGYGKGRKGVHVAPDLLEGMLEGMHLVLTKWNHGEWGGWVIRDGQAPVLMGDCSAHPDLVQAYLWAVDGAATLLLLERFESLFPGAVRRPVVVGASRDDMDRCLGTKDEKALLDEEFSVAVERVTGEGCWSRSEAAFFGKFGAALREVAEGL